MKAAKDKLGNYINYCKVPRKIKSDTERQIYTKLLSAHCSHPYHGLEGHQCCGQVTINAKAITMSCVKCGDSKAVL